MGVSQGISMPLVTIKADNLTSATGTVCRPWLSSLMFLRSRHQWAMVLKHLELFFLPAKPRLWEKKDLTRRRSLDADLLIRAGKAPIACPGATAKIVG